MKRLLEISLIPKTSWYRNVRSEVSRDVWNAIRTHFMKPSCAYCGCKFGLHCHEVWSYDDEVHVQKLTGFETLCFMCHLIVHLGLAGLMAQRGNLDYRLLVRHYCKVNGCTKDEFLLDREEAFGLWRVRSEFEWTVDVSYLDSLNVVDVREWMRAHPDEVNQVKKKHIKFLS